MPVVMGTAGHIDHGKTTLIKHLTGTDCDRLAEEHKRGITIELGFAALDLPDNARLSIIDVPGHERFVHTMMSGAAGIDFVVLVIAADEGVMPQTREHLEICTLLGISTGLVALTKIDMVDPELLELAEEDVAQFLQGTFLENAPIFPVSAHTGEGMPALKDALAEMERTLAPSRRSDLFRLPVDRIFTMKGHGTVVTGTMISGSVSVGDDVTVYPSMRPSKVRGLQSHGTTTETAPAGRRTAVNLHNMSIDDIERGDVLSHPNRLFPADRWIVELTCLPSSPRPLLHRKEIHFHHGARSMQARLYFPDRDKLEPGETAICEVRFTAPAVGVFGDHFVVRSFSPLRTVGGGRLIHPLGVQLRRKSSSFTETCSLLAETAASLHTVTGAAASNKAEAQKQLEAARQVEINRTQAMITLAGESGVTFNELCVLTNLESRTLDKYIALLGGKQLAFCFDKEEKRYISEQHIQILSEQCLNTVTAFHKKNPMKPGVSRSELLSSLNTPLSPKLFHFLTERLVKNGTLTLSGDIVHLPTHRVTLASDQNQLRAKLLHAHTSAGSSPPNMKDVLEELHVTAKEAAPLIKLMQDEHELTKVAEGMWYATSILHTIEQDVRNWFQTHDNLDLKDLKEITGLSRKYLIALMEFFDKEKITVRVGDKRILRK